MKLTQDSDLVGFHEKSSMMGCRIRFERFKKKGPTQCFQCQRFGHVAINCNMPSRCVKCAGSHESNECTIPAKGENTEIIVKTDERTGSITTQVGQTVKCVNCNAEGHTAGAKECPRKLAITRRMEESRANATRKERPRNLGASNLRPGFTFANAAGNFPDTRRAPAGRNTNSSHDLGNAQSTFAMLNVDCKRLLGNDIYSLVNNMGGFAGGYQRLQTDTDKRNALIGFIASLQHNG